MELTLADFLLAFKAERGLVVVDRTKVPLTRLTLAGVQMTLTTGVMTRTL